MRINLISVCLLLCIPVMGCGQGEVGVLEYYMRSRALASGEPLDTKRLVEIAKRHDLRIPPRSACLVLAQTTWQKPIGNESTSRYVSIYVPAYVLEEKRDASIVTLRGAELVTLATQRNDGPLWRPFSTEEVQPKPGGYAVDFSGLSTLVCAVQAAAVGREDTAQELWQAFAAEPWSGLQIGEIDDRAELDHGGRWPTGEPDLLLARCIFDHLRNGLLRDEAAWNVIHTRMNALCKEFPKLKRGWRKDLFKDLTATVRARPSKPDSTEALLLEWSRRPSTMRHLWIFHEYSQSDADAPAREIVLRGCGAIPELIKLLDDRRISAHEGLEYMISPGLERVGQLARQLVREIAGGPGPFPGDTRDSKAIRAWWEKARLQGEADFLAQAVFTREGDKIVGVNETPARIIAHKYPQALQALCVEFSKHATPDAHPFSLAEAVVISDLPKKVRVRVLSDFAQRGSLAHKRCVLQNLAELDGKVCAEILIPLLGTLPRDSRDHCWTSTEASFTHVVMQIEDDAVWREYLRIAKLSSVRLRMEMMGPMNSSYIGKKNRGRRLAFLAAFLDDDAVRDMSDEPGKCEGPCAPFTIPRLQVRDLAAMKIASIFDFEESPDEFWTETQWQSLREKVRTALADQKVPGF